MLKPIFAVIAMLLAMATLPALAAEDGGQQQFSQANELLFLKDHIVESDQPMAYRYELDKSSTLEQEDSFHDEITMTARPGADGEAKNVTFDYLSGGRGKFMRTVEGARGNPIVMMFLQRDVSEMDRLTGGDWRYFQKQIKLGLENNAQVEPVEISYNGSQVAGKRIKLRPFTGAERDAMKKYKEKYYEFTLSEEIPGDIYEMRTMVPGDKEDAEPVIQERLVLKSAEPAEKSAEAN